jgi:hypothetical protein
VFAVSVSDQEIDKIAERIMAEIEHKSSRELAESDENGEDSAFDQCTSGGS